MRVWIEPESGFFSWCVVAENDKGKQNYYFRVWFWTARWKKRRLLNQAKHLY